MPKTPRMHQIPVFDRPREKLVLKGVSSLSDFELNQVVIGNGNAAVDVMYIARKVQSLLSSGTEAVTKESTRRLPAGFWRHWRLPGATLCGMLRQF